jgi:membrane-associated phospholipid phosphatase
LKTFGFARSCLCTFLTIPMLAAAAPVFAQGDDPPPPVPVAARAVADGKTSIDAPIPSVGDLFAASLRDFRMFPSRSTFTWLGVGTVAALAGRPADRDLTHTMTTAPSLSGTFGPGALIGSTPMQLGAAFATYAAGRAAGSSRVALLGADLFRAQLLAQGTTQALKFAVRRVRPDDTPYSFPSGHTSTTFATATVLQRHFGWKVGVPAYGLAAYVGASRIQAKRHYLSDVAFGAALGIVAGRTVTIGRGDGRFAVSPMAAAGGGGVGFTWVGKK